MATIVLQAVGAFLGGALGKVGAAIGSAAGAMAGYALDRSLLEGTRRIEGPRLGSVRPFQAEEGVPLPRVYGTVRIGGNLIWATRFEESRKTERRGSKGGPKVTTYSYFCNVAFALCEGEIAGIRRVWADGREIDLERVTMRVHNGAQDQAPDPLIEAKQGAGNTPAYRGVAYVVFDRLPLGDYGNRIPQFQFEVMRPVGALNPLVRAVALLPGSTEYGLDPRPVTRSPRPGETVQVNRNVLHGASDLVASLDELQALHPNLEDIAVVVTCFGDDLRAGACTITPRVTTTSGSDFSEPWSVCGIARETAIEVSTADGASAFGGTPSDRSVVECIPEIRSRGLRVTLYPFVMMDIPADNGLPDPYGGASQAAYPWRGRITCHPAPGETGSADKTATARTQIDAFAGSASADDFVVAGSSVSAPGLSLDWGYRRFVLHYAHLAAAAGGVDAFLIGSELRGLTTVRDAAGAFPFVEELCGLASQVRAILGTEAAITYGADWSEYFGHHPADGTGDVLFHLDPLWTHEAVSAVGIDNYMPLADWRDGDVDGSGIDGFNGPGDVAKLREAIASGEGFDWYYESVEARLARVRTPITDGAYGKPWTFRTKDLHGWWANEHVNRIGGVEADEPTEWVPAGKPIWFTELGCPAVDKGANQPNVFPDAKSSENAVPWFSSSGRSDDGQKAFLLAHLETWVPGQPKFDADANPVSADYGGRMVDPGRIFLWAWDARPFPAFPGRPDLWKDADNWARGHWLNGRACGVRIGDLIAAIFADHGLAAPDVSAVPGTAGGYLVDAPATARAALEPIVGLYGIGVREDDGNLVFFDEGRSADPTLQVDELVVPEEGATIEHVRRSTVETPTSAELTFADPLRGYQMAVARAGVPSVLAETTALAFPGCLDSGGGEALLADWLRRAAAARETATIMLPANAVDVEPGRIIRLPSGDQRDYIVTEVDGGIGRTAALRRIARAVGTPWPVGSVPAAGPHHAIAGKPHVLMLDLPTMPGGESSQDNFRMAATASPWRGQVAYSSPEDSGYAYGTAIDGPATIGALAAPLGPGREGRLDHGGAIVVELYGGELSSVSQAQMLAGANTGAIGADNGIWEVVQFGDAEEIAPSTWRLSRLLRGQLGTGDAMAAGAASGAPFVLLDGSVVKAGLAPEQAGLQLNWKVGPIGHDFGGSEFVTQPATGGLRARLPLAPAHLRARRLAGGDVRLCWIRRGRIDADGWLAEDIPLGEETEAYRVEVADEGGAVLRRVTVTQQQWTYAASLIDTDFPSLPAVAWVTVRQLGTTVGAGLGARIDVALS
jgi:hypothetical protein